MLPEMKGLGYVYFNTFFLIYILDQTLLLNFLGLSCLEFEVFSFSPAFRHDRHSFESIFC
jgi:hypothetical protein